MIPPHEVWQPDIIHSPLVGKMPAPSPMKNRTRQEVNKIKEEQDPIDLVRNIILTKKYASDEELKLIDNEIKKLIIEAAEFAQQSSEPDPSELWTDVYREVER